MRSALYLKNQWNIDRGNILKLTRHLLRAGASVWQAQDSSSDHAKLPFAVQAPQCALGHTRCWTPLWCPARSTGAL